MATVKGAVKITTSFDQTASNLPGTTEPTVGTPQQFNGSFQTSGGLADQVDLKYSRALHLAAAPTVLDLKALTDIFGLAVAFFRVRSITIWHKGQVDNQPLLVGYATTTTNAWTALVSNPGQITILPSSAVNQGAMAFIAPNTIGYLVTTGSRLLQLDPGANTFDVDVEITGCAE